MLLIKGTTIFFAFDKGAAIFTLLIKAQANA